MKKLLIYIYILAFAASFTACEKEIMDYEGVDGLYFDVRWGGRLPISRPMGTPILYPGRIWYNDCQYLYRTIASSHQWYN